jgi:hypothetical protein
MESVRLPGLVEGVKKSGGYQDLQKDAPHGFKGMNAEVLNVEAGVLVEVGMFNLRAIAPGDKDGLSALNGADRVVGEQAEVAVEIGVVNGQQPQWARIIE